MDIILIIAHGTRIEKANERLLNIAQLIQQQINIQTKVAFIKPRGASYPFFLNAIQECITHGATRIIIYPFFLYEGLHVTKDIPEGIQKMKKIYPHVEFILTEPLGMPDDFVHLIIKKIYKCINKEKQYVNHKSEIIEQESMKIISSALKDTTLKGDELFVVKRVVHATGDIEFAKLIMFHPEAIQTGIHAVSTGKYILTDVGMLKAGIKKDIFAEFGVNIICILDNPEVIPTQDTTRCAMGIRKADNLIDNNIIAIGNAPTALFELCRLIEHGKVKPALVIGTPVGFVGAAESKQKLTTLSVPFITCKGTRGGCSVAASIINAIGLLCKAGYCCK